MATATETLEYRFEESGLSDLRRDMQKLASDFQDAGDEAEQAGASIKEAMEGGEKSVEDLQNELADISTKDAQASFERLERALEDVEGKIDNLDGQAIDIDEGDGESSLMGLGGAAGFVSNKLGAAGASALTFASGVGAVTTATAIGTKQLADFAAAASETGQQLMVAHEQSGVAAERVHELFLIAERLDSNVDLDSLRDAFKEIALRTQEAREGTGEAREAFARLGITMDELRGTSTAEVFDLVRQKASELTAQQRILTLEQIAGGEAGERLARVFGLQAEEYERLKKSVAAETLGAKEVKQMDEMRRQYTRMTQDLRDVKQELALTFGPPAISLLESFTQALQGALEGLEDTPEVGGKLGITSDSLGTPETPDVSFGPPQRVQFGEVPSSGDVPKPVQKMREVFSQLQTSIGVVREKFRRGLVPEDKMLSQIVSFRERAVEELLRLSEQAPDLIPELKINRAVQRLKDARSTDFSLPTANIPTSNKLHVSSPDIASPQEVLGRRLTPTIDLKPAKRLREQLSRINRMPFLPQTRKSKRSVSAVVSTIRDLQSEGRLLSEGMLRGFLEDLDLSNTRIQKIIDKLSETKTEARSLGSTIKRSLVQSIQAASSQLSTDLVSIFSPGDSGATRLKLQKLRLQKQRRALQESLRKREISYREYTLRLQSLNDRLQNTTESLADETASTWKQAFQSMGDFIESVIQQVVQRLTSAAVTAAALAAITGGTSLSVNGLSGFSSVGSLFTQSLTGLDSGGITKRDMVAQLHAGEAVIPLDSLDSRIKSAVQSVQPPSPSPTATPQSVDVSTNVNVTGETKIRGSDLVIALRQALDEEAAIGGPGTL